jgi:hypothetical protein
VPESLSPLLLFEGIFTSLPTLVSHSIILFYQIICVYAHSLLNFQLGKKIKNLFHKQIYLILVNFLEFKGWRFRR